MKKKKTALLIILGFFLLMGYFYSQNKSNDIQKNEENINSASVVEDNHLDEKGEEIAISIIRDLPEVKKWINSFTEPDGTSPKTGGFPVTRVDRVEGSVYVIQVFERVPDIMSTHAATFNWYEVNLETKEVKAEF